MTEFFESFGSSEILNFVSRPKDVKSMVLRNLITGSLVFSYYQFVEKKTQMKRFGSMEIPEAVVQTLKTLSLQNITESNNLIFNETVFPGNPASTAVLSALNSLALAYFLNTYFLNQPMDWNETAALISISLISEFSTKHLMDMFGSSAIQME